MRMTPAPGDVASTGDVTRISDSVHGSRLDTTSTEATNDAITQKDVPDEERARQISSLLSEVRKILAYQFTHSTNIVRFVISRSKTIISKSNYKINRSQKREIIR
jgi:hypothetical protein